MKRVFLIIFLFVASYAHADEQSSQLLARVKARLNSYAAYRVTFASSEISGTITVSGYKFAMINADFEAYYDGQTLWNYDKKKREVNVEDLSPNDPNVMINPSKLLAINEQDFSHRTLSPNVVELVSKNSKTLYSKIVLTINPTSLIPEKIVITDRETGDQAVIVVSGFTPNVPVSIDSFRFDVKKHKGVDVIDFR